MPAFRVPESEFKDTNQHQMRQCSEFAYLNQVLTKANIHLVPNLGKAPYRVDSMPTQPVESEITVFQGKEVSFFVLFMIALQFNQSVLFPSGINFR